MLDAGEVAEQSAGRLVAEHLASYRLRLDRSTEEVPTAELAALAWETRRDPELGEVMMASATAESAQKDLGRHGMRVFVPTRPLAALVGHRRSGVAQVMDYGSIIVPSPS